MKNAILNYRGDTAEILLYGEIGYDSFCCGWDFGQVVPRGSEIRPRRKLNVRINSPGRRGQ